MASCWDYTEITNLDTIFYQIYDQSTEDSIFTNIVDYNTIYNICTQHIVVNTLMHFMQNCGSVRTLDYNLLEKLLRGLRKRRLLLNDEINNSNCCSPASVPFTAPRLLSGSVVYSYITRVVHHFVTAFPSSSNSSQSQALPPPPSPLLILNN